ncbi:MAG TPA: hypothetical protein VNU71_14025 [Burkholderiaceae bacterium]|nr:hypothetical protein [Burkholderiaceae bacterium]
MSPFRHPDTSAARGRCAVGMAWLDAGLMPGLVVVDSNRPAIGAGSARGLLKQFGAAH